MSLYAEYSDKYWKPILLLYKRLYVTRFDSKRTASYTYVRYDVAVCVYLQLEEPVAYDVAVCVYLQGRSVTQIWGVTRSKLWTFF